jgi:hypothetical protein
VAKTWILDTGTKGTGASIRPLEDGPERPQERPKAAPGNVYVPPKPRPRPKAEPAPRPPRRFKVVDILTQETLAENADLRATLGVLREARSNLDVHVHVLDHDTQRWRLLSLDEQRALWDARRRVDDSS